MNSDIEITYEDTLPKKEGQNWSEISYNQKKTGQLIIRDGEIVFSRPEISSNNLYSRGFKTCLALAGINTATRQRVLAHICPGQYYPNNQKRFSTTFIRREREVIGDALKRWRDECAITNENMGMAGSCIFGPEHEAYAETINFMGNLLHQILPGTPQVLALPSRSYGTGQHIGVTAEKIIIVRQPELIKPQKPTTHIDYRDIGRHLPKF